VILLLAAAAFVGHHSLAADFDTTKHVTLTGRITKIEWMNPHVHIYIDVKNVVKDELWSVEMGSPNGLSQRGWTPKSMKVGDVVTVDGSRAKDGSNIANARSIVLPSGVRLSAAPPEGKTS
jgi:hypothetical protein